MTYDKIKIQALLVGVPTPSEGLRLHLLLLQVACLPRVRINMILLLESPCSLVRPSGTKFAASGVLDAPGVLDTA